MGFQLWRESVATLQADQRSGPAQRQVRRRRRHLQHTDWFGNKAWEGLSNLGDDCCLLYPQTQACLWKSACGNHIVWHLLKSWCATSLHVTRGTAELLTFVCIVCHVMLQLFLTLKKMSIDGLVACACKALERLGADTPNSARAWQGSAKAFALKRLSQRWLKCF